MKKANFFCKKFMAIFFIACLSFLFLSAQNKEDTAVVFPQLWHGRVSAVAVSPDGAWIVTGTEDGEIVVYETESGRELRAISAGGEIQALAFFPDGGKLASKSSVGISVWEYLDGKRLFDIQTKENIPVTFSVSPDGGKILSAADEKTVTVWNARTGKEIFSIKNQPGFLGALGWSPDSKYINTASSPGESAFDAASIKVLDAGTGKEIRVVTWDPSSFTAAAFSPDLKQIVIQEDGGDLSLWNTETGKKIRSLFTKDLHGDKAEIFAFSPSGKYIAAGIEREAIHVWDAASGEELVYLMLPWGYEYGGEYLQFTQDEKYILTEAAHGYGACLWEWNTGSGIEFAGTAAGNFKTPSNEHYSAGKKKYNGIQVSSLKLWDAEAAGEIKTFSGNGMPIIKVEWSPDGKQLAAYSSELAMIWDPEAGRLQSTRAMTTQNMISFVRVTITSPDGTLTAREEDEGFSVYRSSSESAEDYYKKRYGLENVKIDGGDENIITVEDEALYTLPTDERIAFSPDSSRIAGIRKDGFVCIWDAVTGKELAQFVFYNNYEWIVISPEGYYNASPGGDHYLNVRIGRSVYGIDQFRELFFRPDFVSAQLGQGVDRKARKDLSQTHLITQIASYSPPEITITGSDSSPAKNSRAISFTEASSAKFRFSVSVEDKNRPLTAIQVFVNGKRLDSDAMQNLSAPRSLRMENAQLLVGKGEKKIEFSLTVDIDNGKNRIEIVASNGYSEARKHIDVAYEAASGEIIPPPKLWILAIGVNKYINPSIPSLNYCVNDARGIIEAFRQQEGKRYAKVNFLLIADGETLEPTAKNIRDSFKFLSEASSQDVVLLFIAGHGVSGKNDAFYYLPKDASFAADGELRESEAISSSEIFSVLNARGNRLVFIDACHSGGLSNKTGSVNNEKLIRSLLDSNAFIFTSSRGSELSQEKDTYKHGIFTYALIQGLNGNASSASGRISMMELGAYVSREVKNITNNKQNPCPFTMGFSDFDIALY